MIRSRVLTANLPSLDCRTAHLLRCDLGQPLEFLLDGVGRMADVLHRLRQPFLGYIELVGPLLDLVRLEQADAAAVLRTFVLEIIWHGWSPSLRIQRR